MPTRIPTQKLPLGATELEVTPVCVGCAQLGNMPETFGFSVAESQALETIRSSFDGPINFLDTAASYGDGESERRIGLIIAELGGLPEGFVLATKADRDMVSGDFSGEQMKRSIDRSLRLLGVDTLQLVYLHDPEYSSFETITAPRGALEVLTTMVDEGVIQHLGIAGGPVELMIRYVETGAFEAVISHNRFTLLYQTADRLFQLASDRGMAVVNAAPYGSGLLAKGSVAYPRYLYAQATPDVLERTRRMEDVCRAHKVPLAAVALQFSLSDPRISSTIIGMSHPQRIQETLNLATLEISQQVWEELSHIPPSLEEPASIYP